MSTPVSPPPRISRWVQLGPTALVIAQTFNFYAFVVRARLALGYWPAPYHPDPKTLGFELHAALVALGFLFVSFGAPCLQLVVVALTGRWGVTRRDSVMGTLVFTMVFGGAFALTRLDPGAFGDWFMD